MKNKAFVSLTTLVLLIIGAPSYGQDEDYEKFSTSLKKLTVLEKQAYNQSKERFSYFRRELRGMKIAYKFKKKEPKKFKNLINKITLCLIWDVANDKRIATDHTGGIDEWFQKYGLEATEESRQRLAKYAFAHHAKIYKVAFRLHVIAWNKNIKSSLVIQRSVPYAKGLSKMVKTVKDEEIERILLCQKKKRKKELDRLAEKYKKEANR